MINSVAFKGLKAFQTSSNSWRINCYMSQFLWANSSRNFSQGMYTVNNLSRQMTRSYWLERQDSDGW